MVQPFENQAYRKERQNSTAGGNIYPQLEFLASFRLRRLPVKDINKEDLKMLAVKHLMCGRNLACGIVLCV